MAVKIHFVFWFLFPFMGWGQNSSTLMGARQAGMGYSSSVLTDEWSFFNNIGGIGKVNETNAIFAYDINPALIGANRLAAALQSPTKWGTAGVGIFRFGDDVYSEHLFSVGFGNTMGNTSLGAKCSYVQYRAEGFGTLTAINLDFDGVTQLTNQISLGAYLTNLTQSKLTGAHNEHLPAKLVAGISFRPSDKVLVSTELEKDLMYPAIWRSGLEYTLYKKIFVRTGFNLNPNAAFFGLGAQKKKIKMDYALRFNQLTGTVHQASAVYLFASKRFL